MGIYFGGGNRFVTEHLLNRPQIGTSFNQVRGEGVTERMRTNIFPDSHLIGQFFDSRKYRYSGELLTA
jgi:hypothetical protein